jgi:inosine-uridine nucleoside N-ribohydrolase
MRFPVPFVALLWAIGLLCSGTARADAPDGHDRHRPRIPQVMFSTDVAIGLIDTHGGKSLAPASFDVDHDYTTDTDVAPQDIDDGLALAMALNLDAAGLLNVLAVVPTYGNASLPAQMLVARQIVRVLKQREDIPIVPGATSPASQTLHPTPVWFDGETVTVEGRDGSFAASCVNQGVALMRDRLEASREPVTMLAIGPLTDVACLLMTAERRVTRKIKEVIAIASRLEGQSLTVNGEVVNDFNFRMDPVGGTLLLWASGRARVPLRLMSFSLTGQTSQDGDVIAFDAATYPGRQPPTPASEASFRWLLAAAGPRNDYWSSIFGTDEGPFDQYALVAAIRPELFECRMGRAYVQQCPYPAWSPDYPTDANGDPTEEPYNAPDNPCTDHGSANGSALSQIPAELVVTLDRSDDGPLVRGTTGIDGNIPMLDGPARRVRVCTGFASPRARQAFEDFLKRWTW